MANKFIERGTFAVASHESACANTLLLFDMTLEDPFYVVKDEVFRALNKTRGLYLRWQEIARAPAAPSSPEVEWTSTELRNALRSIEWDLEDLEDTISIVEKNSSKFKIDNREISDRRTFIEATKREVKAMRGKMSASRHRDGDGAAREPLLADESPVRFGHAWTATPKYSRYSKLASHDAHDAHDADDARDGLGAAPAGRPYADDEPLAAQGRLLAEHDGRLLALGGAVGSLRTVSRQIGAELDEQAVMLDELSAEMDSADSKLDSTLKKVARALHVDDDRRQWLAIGVLLLLLLIALLLFVVM